MGGNAEMRVVAREGALLAGGARAVLLRPLLAQHLSQLQHEFFIAFVLVGCQFQPPKSPLFGQSK